MTVITAAWYFLTMITFISVVLFLVHLAAPATQVLSPSQVVRTPRGRTVALIMLTSALLSFMSALAYITFGN